jgi:two-component system alkaline phosphatase synthesis response regulator PhoP
MDDSTATKTILIADDDPFIIKAFKAGLELHDYTVVTARDGEEALEQIAAVQPNLVLLDVIMPKKDGFEVLKTLKADPSLAHIPIVMLTSLAQESDAKTAREYGAIDFLVKSDISMSEIVARVQKLLEETAEAATRVADSVRTETGAPDLPSGQFAAETVEASSEDGDSVQKL